MSIKTSENAGRHIILYPVACYVLCLECVMVFPSTRIMLVEVCIRIVYLCGTCLKARLRLTLHSSDSLAWCVLCHIPHLCWMLFIISLLVPARAHSQDAVQMAGQCACLLPVIWYTNHDQIFPCHLAATIRKACASSASCDIHCPSKLAASMRRIACRLRCSALPECMHV